MAIAQTSPSYPFFPFSFLGPVPLFFGAAMKMFQPVVEDFSAVSSHGFGVAVMKSARSDR